MNKYKIYCFLYIIYIFKFKELKKDCEENNINDNNNNFNIMNDNISYKLQYHNIFLNLPIINITNKNYSNYFDFKINDKILPFLNENKITPFPLKRFAGKQQGNFLHFFEICFSKKLPFYFSTDFMIYPYIESTKFLITEFLENIFFNLYQKFLHNVIKYIKNNNYSEDYLLYFSYGLKFLDINNSKIYKNEEISKIVNNLLNFNNITKDNLKFNIYLFNKTQTLNKFSFIQLPSLFKKTNKTLSIGQSIRFFQNFIFNFDEDFEIIYNIGKIISLSNKNNYIKIKKIFKYLTDEEEPTLNPFDIYNLIDNNSTFYEDIQNKKFNIIYKKIKDNLIKNSDFNFKTNFTFSSKFEEINYNKTRNSITSLFSYNFPISEWINLKLLNIKKNRMFTSVFELIDILFHANLMKKIINDRYIGNKNSNERYYKFRDGINVTDQFNEIKKIIKNSLKNNKDIWFKTYENSFNYLLNLNGYDLLERKNIFGFKAKTFNTAIGAFSHFKNDISLFTQYVNINPTENGKIIDIYFEPKIKFYKILKEITNNFYKSIKDISFNINSTFDKILDFKINNILKACDNILKIINFQNKNISNTENEEKNNLLNLSFFYNFTSKNYDGWYVDLYKKGINKDSNKEMYKLEIFATNYYTSLPLKNIKYNGVIVYCSMHYPEFGLIQQRDNISNINKILLYSSYAGNEYPHEYTKMINFNGLRKLIINRD